MPTLVRFKCFDPAVGGVTWRRFGTQRYVSPPDSGEPDIQWDPRVKQPGNFTRRLFKPGQTFGSSEVGYGEVVLVNADGALDPLCVAGRFDGQPIEIWRGERAGRFPQDFTLVFAGTMEGFVARRRELGLRIRDRRAEIAERLVVETRYRGDNVPPDGLEGTADDLADALKPVPVGRSRGTRLVPVNRSKLIFQASADALTGVADGLPGTVAVESVEDGGSALTLDSPYATLADLLNDGLAPAAGHAAAYVGAEGVYVRLGGDPSGEVTATLAEGGSAGARAAGAAMTRVLRRSGVPSGDIRGAAALDVRFPAELGWSVDTSGARTGDVLDRLAASVHGFWAPDALNRVRLGRLEAPSGPPVAVFDRTTVLNQGNALERLVDAREGLPVWRVTVKYRRCWTVQSATQLAGIAFADRAFWSNEWRRVTVEDEAIRARHPLAREIELDTALDAEADAATLAAFLLRLYGVKRDVYEVASAATFVAGIDLADTVALDLPRFDLGPAKLFRVIAIDQNLARNRAVFTLWG